MITSQNMTKEVWKIHHKETTQKLIDEQMDIGYKYALMFFVKENTLNLSYDDITDSLCKDQMPQGVEFYYPHCLLTPEFSENYIENGLYDLYSLMEGFLENLFEYAGDCDLTRISHNLKRQKRLNSVA